ncbi:MAG: hypothetical protein C0501_01410 [Isosphaera sp.]|nr:hypothetical protein [Isosphaera sp.]
MPFFSSGARLSRRTFLRGAGAAVGLPLLDAMRPAFAKEPPAPRRFLAVMYSLGFHGPHFFPTAAGRDYVLSPYLEPLKAVRDQFTVFSGLSHPEQAGANGHTSEFTWLTAAFRPMLPGFKNTVSLDQLIAAKVGPQTRFPYLSLGTTRGSLSWTPNGVAIPGLDSPAALFKQLFVNGTPAEVGQQVRELRQGKSILDTVSGEAKKLERTLGPADKQKVGDYLAAVRELEGQLQMSEGWVNKPKPVVAAKPPTDVANRLDAIAKQKLMFDMIVLALQTDSTRTVTFMTHGMNAVPVVEGVTHDWHELSHHGQDAGKIDELKRIELAEVAAFAGFLGNLRATKEAGGTLLDGTAVLFGSNLGNASSHDTRNLPVLVAGGGFRHGGHVAAGDGKANVPFCNLFLSLAGYMGVEATKFGSSTGVGVTGFEAK